MKKAVLTWGFLAGGVSAAMMLATLTVADSIGFEWGEVIGYTMIVLSSLLVFFGVRSYRQAKGGPLGFGRAFAVGLLITLISCACYVATWELVYFELAPGFVDKYGAHMIATAKAKGASPEKLAAVSRQIQEMKRLYDNPLTNAAVTFLEPLPIGLLAALLSAGALRRRGPA